MKRFLFAISVCLIITSCARKKNIQPSLILYNGRVWTGQDQNIFEEGLAVVENSITAVGSSDEVLRLAGDSTQLIDLQGKLVIPGFNDAHIHFLNGSRGLTQVELTSTKSANEVFEYLKEYASNHPDRAWITGRGWQYAFFDGGFPDKQMLDKIIPNRPVYVRAYDGHTAWVNSKALALAGIDRNTKYEGFGEVARDKNGEPTGVLKESAMSLVSDLIPPFTKEENLKALRVGMQLAARLGITSIQNANGTIDEVELYEELLRNHELTVRTSLAFSVNQNTTKEDLQSFVKVRNRVGENPMLRANSVKFVIDGVIEGHTGYMIEPYSDEVPEGIAPTGQVSMPLERFQNLVISIDSLRFQIYTHAIGDGGVRETLNAYELAREKNGLRNSRHRVEHIEIINSDDIPRFKELEVMASMQPIHAQPGEGESVWEIAVGPERLPNAFAWASLLEADAKLVFSSDWPACLSVNPIRGLHVAVTRQNPQGIPKEGWVVDQKINMTEALGAYTKMGAYSSFEEDVKGQIRPGYLADVVVLSQDLFTIDPAETYKTEVAMTIFDGEIIYDNTTK